ncbi:MAG TPA: DNA repair protein RadA, partial [Burkholderiales bacterium]|nr:DNA repair protein RadA [Burkholderiales bacterium]
MAKPKTAYVCSECGATALQWFGTCPSCGAAGTLTETSTERSSPRSGSRTVGVSSVSLAEVQPKDLDRL